MLEEYRTIALRVERAFANVPPGMRLRFEDGSLVVAMPNTTVTEKAEGPITAEQVYELAAAVLYANLERKGKG